MSMQTSGTVYALFDAKQVTERFRKREFVITLDDNSRYPNHVLFQLTGDRCEQLDGYQVGDKVRVEFSLRGREWKSPQGDTRYFNSLDVWQVEKLGGHAHAGGPAGHEPPPPLDEDIPF